MVLDGVAPPPWPCVDVPNTTVVEGTDSFSDDVLKNDGDPSKLFPLFDVRVEV